MNKTEDDELDTEELSDEEVKSLSEGNILNNDNAVYPACHMIWSPGQG